MAGYKGDMECALTALVSACGAEDAALAARFQQATSAGDAAAAQVVQLSRVMCEVAVDPRRKNIFATDVIRDLFFLLLVKHATTPEAVTGLARAMRSITTGDDAAAARRKDTFATETVRDGFFVPLLKHATPASVDELISTTRNLTAGTDAGAAHRKAILLVDKRPTRPAPPTSTRRNGGESAPAVGSTAMPVPSSTSAPPPTGTQRKGGESTTSAPPHHRDVVELQAALQKMLKIELRVDDAPAAHRRTFLRLAEELKTHDERSRQYRLVLTDVVAAAKAVLADPQQVACCSPKLLEEIKAHRVHTREVVAAFDAQLVAAAKKMSTDDNPETSPSHTKANLYEAHKRTLEKMFAAVVKSFEAAGIPQWVEQNEKDRKSARDFLDRVEKMTRSPTAESGGSSSSGGSPPSRSRAVIGGQRADAGRIAKADYE